MMGLNEFPSEPNLPSANELQWVAGIMWLPSNYCCPSPITILRWEGVEDNSSANSQGSNALNSQWQRPIWCREYFQRHKLRRNSPHEGG